MFSSQNWTKLAATRRCYMLHATYVKNLEGFNFLKREKDGKSAISVHVCLSLELQNREKSLDPVN